ncbi:MAG TPA: hypothetical protein VHS81_06980 [Caulobacteraceae bacterium]|nr:hypothetical protein [Caulobacteraceae bacterium]
MTLSILVCIASLFALLWLLRRDQLSLGLPMAYMGSLLLIHVPGAIAHAATGERLQGNEYVQTGIFYTAIGCVCFVVGVGLARATTHVPARPRQADRRAFAYFCLIGGWTFVYGLSPLNRITSLGAVIETGGAIWMLGTMLGLRAALHARDLQRAMIWGAALAVYPVLMLLLGGFLSYGVAAVMVVLSILTICARSYSRAAIGIVVAAFLGVTFFVNYFDHRDEIRANVWGGASMGNRLGSVTEMLTGFHLIDLGDDKDLTALDVRLNQNSFVGLAAARIQQGQVDFLKGQSVTDGIISVIPRAIWPDKPTTAGSGQTVAELTGLELNQDTSWGVGNVMEFYINFGIPGVVVGFLVLGWLIGVLDFRAAAAERRADFKTVIICFVPSVALINPNGSLVEITGGAAAALVAALGWRWGWGLWQSRELALAAQRRHLRAPQPGPDPAV